jgi:hypothetical protein
VSPTRCGMLEEDVQREPTISTLLGSFWERPFLQQGGITHASRNGEKRFGDNGMLLRQRIKTVTHVVELLNFMQDSQWDSWAHSFPESLRSEHFRWADLVQET